MIPGIDPKIDIAFKKVFGSESFRDLTAALINAVLEPPPEHRVIEVEFLNPYSEKVKLDDKLSILDVKRDQAERLYNLEMQMLALAALSPRVLYYWARNYGQQLAEGDDYTRLRRTISICFVNGTVFSGWPEYHTRFRLLDPGGKLCLTEDLEIHVIELPKFPRTLTTLQTPLDFWLYFFKNGTELDADALPPELERREICRAMEVLKMLAQNDMERELYEGRLKARRDLQTLETQRRTLEDQRRTLEDQRQALKAELDKWQQRCAEANRECEEANREREEANREREEANREREEANREREEANREREEANREREEANREREEAKRMVVRQIQFCEYLLGRQPTDADQLKACSIEQLRELAGRLEQESKT